MELQAIKRKDPLRELKLGIWAYFLLSYLKGHCENGYCRDFQGRCY
jgi:hypothetical protein